MGVTTALTSFVELLSVQPIIWALEERISVCVTRKTKEHCSFMWKDAYLICLVDVFNRIYYMLY